MEKIFLFFMTWLSRVSFGIILILTSINALLFCLYLVGFALRAGTGDKVWSEHPASRTELVQATSFIFIALLFKSRGMITEILGGDKKEDNESK